MSRQLRNAQVRKTYEFIKGNQRQYGVQVLCRVLGIAPSGYYAWLKKPVSHHGLEDARLLRLIRASYTASQGVYGWRRFSARSELLVGLPPEPPSEPRPISSMEATWTTTPPRR